MTKLLLTTQEAAERLTVSPRTLLDWRSSGKESLRYVRIGRKIRYTQKAIEDYITRNTQCFK